MIRAAREDGDTLIEVIVAAFFIVVVVGAAAMAYLSASDSSLAGQRGTQLVELADKQIEAIRQQVKTSGFSSLALSSAPPVGTGSNLYTSSTDTDPDDFVSTSSGCGSSNLSFQIDANWNSTSEGAPSGLTSWSGCPSGAEPLVIDAANGFVVPEQTVTVGNGQATIYSYVTDTYVGCSSSLGSCTSTAGDARRVVVAVELNNGGTKNTGSGSRLDQGQNTPYYLTTVFTNPVPSNQVNNSLGLTLGAQLG